MLKNAYFGQTPYIKPEEVCKLKMTIVLIPTSTKTSFHRENIDRWIPKSMKQVSILESYYYYSLFNRTSRKHDSLEERFCLVRCFEVWVEKVHKSLQSDHIFLPKEETLEGVGPGTVAIVTQSLQLWAFSSLGAKRICVATY